MVLPPKFRTGFVLMLLGLTALLLAGGGWALFSAFGFVLLDAAAGIVSEARHLNDLFVLQNAAWTFAVLVTALLAFALAVLYVTEARRRRNEAEIVRVLAAYAAGEWSEAPHVHQGDVLDEVAGAAERLGAAMRAKSGGDGGEAEEIKSRFLEIISHQLRSPLTAVRWNIEALLRGEVGDLTRRQEELLRITDKNYRNILVMLSDWVEALEVERGLLHLNPEPIEVAPFVAAMADEFRSQAKLKKLSFRVTVRPEAGRVYADRLKLHYVFNKLLHNAMSYTREGGKVALRAALRGRSVRFEVADTGVGIPLSEQPEIFKKFFRATNASLMQPNASGVGLFVAKTLVEAHGGTIGFVSTEGRGTTFTFDLPAAAGAPAEGKGPRRKSPPRG